MYNLPYTNKQINIPYLLKIGNGKIYKIGKYLKDKNLPGVALFLGDGTEELVGAELRRGFGDNDINVVHSQVVSDISIESITQTAFQLPPATDVVVGIGGGKALDLQNIPHIFCVFPLSVCRHRLPTTAFAARLLR